MSTAAAAVRTFVDGAFPSQPTAPIDLIDELPNNPRAHWGDMDGLAASIKAKGVLEPLVVRPIAKGRLQLLCGARRFRASKAAGLTEVPITVREGVSDLEALELALIENLQRHDVHRLNEALSMDALMKADPLYTVEALSARLGKSPAHIKDTLRLLKLSKPVREAYAADEILDGHALLIAQLPEARHKDALAECYLPMWQSEGDKKALRSVSQLKRWIADTQPLDLAAPETAEMFPDLAETVARERTYGDQGIVRISDRWDDLKRKGEPTILGRDHWREAGKKDACGSEAVVALGARRGQIVRVCVTNGCPKHFPKAKSVGTATAGAKKTPAQRKAEKAAATREANRREQERQKRARRDTIRARALEAAVAKVTSVTRDVARLLFSAVFDRFDLTGEPLEAAFAAATGLKVQGFRVVGDVANLTEAQLAKGLLFHELAGIYHEPAFIKALKGFKVDVGAIERQVIADEKKAAAAKKAEAKAAIRAKAAAAKKSVVKKPRSTKATKGSARTRKAS